MESKGDDKKEAGGVYSNIPGYLGFRIKLAAW